MKSNAICSLPSESPLVFNGNAREFVREVTQHTGGHFQTCLHCRSCASGCPFSDAMCPLPDGIFRMIQLGMRSEALSCNTLWICVGCNTCSVQCPMAIDIPAVMDSLRQISIAEGVQGPEPDILAFHREVLSSIRRYGRTHKFEIMLRYKLKRRDFLTDMNLGLKMLARRKLDLRPSQIRRRKDLAVMFRNGGSNARRP